MNTAEVITALEGVMNKDSEAYIAASGKVAHLPADIGNIMICAEVAAPLVDILAKQPEFQQRPNLMLNGDNARIGFQPNSVAPKLVAHGLKDGAVAAVAWLDKILTTKKAECFHVAVLHGVKAETRIAFADGFELVPYDALPQSPRKTSFDSANALGPFAAWRFNRPAAALIKKDVMEPFLLNGDEPFRPQDDAHPSVVANEICLALTATVPCSPAIAVEWLQFVDPVIEDLGMGGYWWQNIEIPTRPFVEPVKLDKSAARAIVERYLEIHGETRDKLRVALQRLNQALRRISTGDKAIDCAIALEVLVTGDGQGENTWKVGLRAAQLAGGTLQEMVHNRAVVAALYELRSSMVHDGVVRSSVRVRGQGRRPSAEVFNEAAKVCAAAIRAVIERRSLPDWFEFDLVGGLRSDN